MHRQTPYLFGSLFVLIVLGMLCFAYLKSHEMRSKMHDEQELNSTDHLIERYGYLTAIEATDFYSDGVHLIAGSIILPNPCEELMVNVLVAESYPEQVTLDFTTKKTSDFCAQVMTAAPFSVEVTASGEATFKTLFMGRTLPLTLTPVSGE